MGIPSKRQKPPFSINANLRQKELGWNAHRVAKEARIPYPTVRDILAGVSPGLEENRLAIARALGKSLAELYSAKPLADPGPPRSEVVRKSLQSLAKQPLRASVEDLKVLIEHLKAIGPNQRALGLALLAGDYEVAKPLLSEDYPLLVSLLKAL